MNAINNGSIRKRKGIKGVERGGCGKPVRTHFQGPSIMKLLSSSTHDHKSLQHHHAYQGAQSRYLVPHLSFLRRSKICLSNDSNHGIAQY
jgi:hypothetical protein